MLRESWSLALDLALEALHARAEAIEAAVTRLEMHQRGPRPAGAPASIEERLAAIEEKLAALARSASFTGRATAGSAPGDDLLDSAEAAAIAKVTPGTVREWIRRGRLPASRPPGGRKHVIRRADLLAYLRDEPSNGVDIEAEAERLLRS